MFLYLKLMPRSAKELSYQLRGISLPRIFTTMLQMRSSLVRCQLGGVNGSSGWSATKFRSSAPQMSLSKDHSELCAWGDTFRMNLKVGDSIINCLYKKRYQICLGAHKAQCGIQKNWGLHLVSLSSLPSPLWSAYSRNTTRYSARDDGFDVCHFHWHAAQIR